MLQTTRGVFVAAVLLVAAAPGRGDEPPAIRLAEVIEEARVQNPEIKAARARAQAASYVPAQASATAHSESPSLGLLQQHEADHGRNDHEMDNDDNGQH